jgi:hypothetical protein
MKTDATKVLSLIATMLESPTNRFGKYEFYTEESQQAREQIRLLAVKYKVTDASTILEQAARVARVVLSQ